MSVVQDVMARNKSDSPDDSYLAGFRKEHAEWLRKFNADCDKYGMWEHRTPEQQAAFDAMHARYSAHVVEIRTEEDVYEMLCERYIVTHGRVEFDPGFRCWHADWNRVREMAKERGYVD